MIINHNMNALNAHRNMSINTVNSGKSMEKLSSGLRINRAGDDAAGLAISEKMTGQIRGLDQASRNAQDGISLIQTAEGALNETHSILQRMRELAVQSSNDTNTTTDRKELQKEVDQLAEEITRIANNTEFNTKKLMGPTGTDANNPGNFSGKFHIGANAGQDITLTIADMSAKALGVNKATPGASVELKDNTGLNVSNITEVGYTIKFEASTAAAVDKTEATVNDKDKTITLKLAQTATKDDITATLDDVKKALEGTGKFNVTLADGVDATKTKAKVGTADTTVTAGTIDQTKGIDISTQGAASAAITTINTAIETVSAERSKLGAYQNRLEHTINNLGTSSENLTAAESRVRDVDMAKEMMAFSKNNILSQAAQAMLAQANQQPQGVQQLLR